MTECTDKTGDKALVILCGEAVLVDREAAALRALAESLADLGLVLARQELCDRLLGGGWRAIVRTLRDQYGLDLPADAAALLHEEVLRRYRADLRPLPGAADLLHGLTGSGRRLCLVSQSEPCDVDAALAATGLQIYFAGCILADPALANPAHAPAVLLRACRQFEIAPAGSIVVADAPAGIAAAQAAGLTVIGFTGSDRLGFDADDAAMVALKPDGIADSLAEVAAMLGLPWLGQRAAE